MNVVEPIRQYVVKEFGYLSELNSFLLSPYIEVIKVETVVVGESRTKRFYAHYRELSKPTYASVVFDSNYGTWKVAIRNQLGDFLSYYMGLNLVSQIEAKSHLEDALVIHNLKKWGR